MMMMLYMAAPCSLLLLWLPQCLTFSPIQPPIISTTPYYDDASASASTRSRRRSADDGSTTKLYSDGGGGEGGGGGVMALDPAETAVVFLKFQNDFASPGGKIYETVKEVMDATNMVQNSKKFVDLARKMGCTVVHCPLSTEPGQSCVTAKPFGVVERVRAADALKHDEWGGQIADDMTPVEGDLVIPKYGMCAFSTSNLDEELRSRGIKNVICAGFLTNGSVESTIRTAYERCYDVFALTDCCAACTMEEHVFSIQQNFGMFAVLTNGPEMIQAMMNYD